MSLRVAALAVVAALLAACAASPRPTTSAEVVTVSVAPSGGYVWQYQEWSLEQLRAVLASEQARMPFKEMHFVAGAGEMTIGQMLQVAVLGKELGATVYVESDGKLREFTVK